MHACRTHRACTAKALSTAEKVCREKGLRFTALRRKVLELIWAGHAPVKAYDILAKLDSKTTVAKPPTVYRTLAFLLENGLVHKFNSLNAYVGCSHPLKHGECYFLFCSTCREIKECCGVELEQAIKKAAGKNQFRPKHASLEIEGECVECRRRSPR